MSTLSVSNITDGTDTVETGYVVNGSAKAWWYTDASATLQDSFNISTSTDVSTGRQQVDFTSSMSSSSYAATTSTRTATSACYVTTVYNINSSNTVVQAYRASADTFLDRNVAGSIAGDLA